METILIGNGVTIQYGGDVYSNSKIIKRARNKINTKNYPEKVYHRNVLLYLTTLCEQVSGMVKGDYDNYAITPSMKKSLVYFKERYSVNKQKYELHEIGLEDYFILHIFASRRAGVENPDRFSCKEGVRMFFLDAIYNEGKIQELHTKYDSKFIKFLLSFDKIYTTNYDWNLEKATGNAVGYLHACFHELDDVYNPNSLRNQLEDSPIKMQNLVTPDGYEYLHSTALMAGSGEDKELSLSIHTDANSSIKNVVEKYLKDEEYRKLIDSYESSEHEIQRKIYQMVQLRIKDNSIRFKEFDAIQDFKTINSNLSVLGLSLYNDNHLFEKIRTNEKIANISYYYYDEKDKDVISVLFPMKPVHFIDAKEFWKEIKG